jgi:hypothetical protein
VSYPYQAMPDPTAVVGRRVLATIVDGLVIVVPAAAVAAAELDLQYLDEDEIGVSVSTFCDTYDNQDSSYVCVHAGDRVYFSDQAPTLGAPTGLLISLLMLVVLQGLTGWTIGKAITGIRAVREDGRAPGLGRAALRWLLLIVDSFPWCVPLLGFILVVTNKGHRRVGDMAAHTFVVSKAAMGQPVVVPGLTPAAGYAYPQPGAPVPSGGWGAPGQGGAPSGDAWGAQPSPAGPGAPGAWGRDPASADSWPAAPGYTTPSGERPAPPTSPPDTRPAPPGAAPAWAPSTGETQVVPTAPEPPADAPAESSAPAPAGEAAPGPAAVAGAEAGAGPEAGAAELTVPFTGEPVPGTTVPDDSDLDGDATQLHPGPAEPGAAAGHEPPPDTEVEAPREPEPSVETGPPSTAAPAHPLDVSGPSQGAPAAAPGEAPAPEPGTAAEPAATPEADATVVGEAPAAGPDTDATVVGGPSDLEPTVAQPVAEADKTMVAPAAVSQPAPATYNPQWDAARGTYIVWEPGRGKWLGWDDAAKEWRPL